jgi:hypothetical protein
MREIVSLRKPLSMVIAPRSAIFKKGNAAFDRMEVALGRLRQRDDKGESILRELLAHSDGWVRLASARHLLPLRADCACKTP